MKQFLTNFIKEILHLYHLHTCKAIQHDAITATHQYIFGTQTVFNIAPTVYLNAVSWCHIPFLFVTATLLFYATDWKLKLIKAE
jgi:hypothetical protein